MSATNQATYPHRCRSNEIAGAKCRFCRICGVHMTKNAPGTVYFRSEKYNVVDPFRLDDNVVLSEMLKKQGNNRYYNAQAHHLTYRAELLGFVEELALKLDYSESTFHLAIGMLDALLSLYAIDRKQIKMVSFMALNLAAKMQENSAKIPELPAIAQLFENQFSTEELVNCEALLTKVLGYSLNIKTPHAFVEYFHSKGIVSNKDLRCRPADQCNDKLEQFEKLVSFFLQVSNSHYDFYKYTSVAVATAAIACARKLIGFESVWNKDLENITHVAFGSIEHCCTMLYEAAEETYPILTPQVVLGSPVEEFECPPLINGLKSRGSIFTEATSEKDDRYDEAPQVSEFKLYDSEDEAFGEPMKFVVPYDFNSC